MSLFNNISESVREVNRKYAKPEIEMTAFVKICLVVLRVYLLAMVGLMTYALIKAAISGGNPSQTTAANAVANVASPASLSTNATGSQP